MPDDQQIAADAPAHAYDRRLQTVALTLFDRTAAAHRLPPQARRPLQVAVAAYAHSITAGVDDAPRRARDLILAGWPADLSEAQRALAGAVAAFQREKVRPQREPAFLRLDTKDRNTALRLAALLRLAYALAAEQGGELMTYVSAGTTTLAFGGERAAALAQSVRDRAGLWGDVVGPLVVREVEPGEHALLVPPDGAAPADAELPPYGPMPGGLHGGESIAEGARRVLRRLFEKLLAREESVSKDDDIEDVHQMRVATRRLRAALQVVQEVYDPALIRRYRRKLRRLAGALGVVRDYDVLLLHMREYSDRLPADGRALIAPVTEAVAAGRTRGRAKMLRALDAQGYARFKRDFAVFLTSAGYGVAETPATGVAPRVRDFAGSAIWQRYEQWRAYEVVIDGPPEVVHQARIAGKRLRYTLEFFGDALGPAVDQALQPLMAVQEALGALQDGVVAGEHLRSLGVADDPGAQVYLSARTAESEQHRETMRALWDKVVSGTYRRRLFEMIVKL